MQIDFILTPKLSRFWYFGRFVLIKSLHMKWLISMLPLLFLLQSCGLKEREQNLTRREKEIAQKQTDLLLKEQQLAQKEKDLAAKELSLDSTRRQIDSVNIYNADLIGKWSVKMNCTETTCEGSAIGDTKSEQWEINYNPDHSVTVKAFAGKNLSRIYTGYYKTTGLHLVDENTIHVTLSLKSKDKMEGIREILQPNCKIIYSISAEKILQK